MRIGILGGTFDPIHFAHLLVAEDARVQLALNRVLFIPNGAPPHRGQRTSAAASDRLRMCELATADNPAFAVCAMEVERSGPSYAADTLQQLGSENPGAELYFLAGIDAVAELQSWYRADDVVRMCTFVAASRPGFTFEQLRASLPAATLERVVPLETPYLAISATAIRERVQQGLPIRYLTPEPVVEYITEHGLYAGASRESAVESRG